MDMIINVLKLFFTFLASLLFGIERQRSHKPVGFGTFMFVSIGSCALGIIVVSEKFPNSVSLLGAVVTGIGFLGAGALIRGNDKVFGFTTASAVWLFAIYGLLMGIGEYFIGSIIYIIVWIIIFTDYYLESKSIGSYRRKITLVTDDLIYEKEINKQLLLYTKKNKLISADINKEKNEIMLVYLVEGSKSNLNKMIRSIYKEKWLKSSKIE